MAPETLRARARRHRPAGRQRCRDRREPHANLRRSGADRCRRSSPPRSASRSRCASRRTVPRSPGGRRPAEDGAAQERRRHALLPADRRSRATTSSKSATQRGTLAVAPAAASASPTWRRGGPWGLAVQLYGLRRAGRRRDRRFRRAARFRARRRRAWRRRGRDQPGARAVLRRPRPLQPVRAVQPGRCSTCCTRTLPRRRDAGARGREALPLIDWPAAARAGSRACAAPSSGRGHARRSMRFRARTRRRAGAARPLRGAARASLRRGPRPLALARLARGVSRPGQPGGRRRSPATMRTRSPSMPGCNCAPTRASPRRRRRRARPGMPIGLISDLAVGTDGGGSHAWSRQDETLIGLTVGAPPDLLEPARARTGASSASRRAGCGSTASRRSSR